MKLETQAVNTDPKAVLLKVSFDVSQTSDALDWEFLPNSRPTKGNHAGGILFQPKEKLFLEIDGIGSDKSGFSGFDIIECCLITMPQIIQIGAKLPLKYAAPSPFRDVPSAVFSFPHDFQEGVVPAPSEIVNRERQFKQTWQGDLVVAEAPGRWELSFVVTVRIHYGSTQPSELRVFSFDPETEVGEGSVPS
jgi:hypothetical protein